MSVCVCVSVYVETIGMGNSKLCILKTYVKISLLWPLYMNDRLFPSCTNHSFR